MFVAKRRKAERGLTYVELMVSVAILSLISVLFFQVIDVALASWDQGNGKAELLHTAQRAMERMVSKVRTTTWVLLPQKDSDPGDFNAYDPSYPNRYYPRDILAVSANVDNDGDGLADEDPSNDITEDGISGIMGIDDNDAGGIDESGQADDDEAGANNEDPINGIDDDHDGMTDEDPGDSFYNYFNCGNGRNDDDIDGTSQEDPLDPLVYYLDGSTLMERLDVMGVTQRIDPLAENVAEFQVLRRRVDGNTLIDLHLKLDDGRNSVELYTTVFAFQRVTP